MNKRTYLLFIFLLAATPSLWAKTTTCNSQGVWLQVLGSGGPELDDGRASSAYLIWQAGKARILIDMGGGSALRFEQSGASLHDLDVILFTHLHADHSNDLPALLKASYFANRKRDLPLYGPTGNHLMPSLTRFVQNLFGPDGAFRYLSDYLDGKEAYRLLAHNIEAKGNAVQVLKTALPYRLLAVPVHHGPIPALAWRVEIAGRSLVFSGDMNDQNNVLARLAKQADILIAHHAIAEQPNDIARHLHMPPSVIGQIAAKAGVKQLLLSHRMNRTLGREQVSLGHIRHSYTGTVQFADDLQCYKL